MKRLLALLLGGLGLRALLRRRGHGEAGAAPADELREKLASAKAMEEEREVFESGETPVDKVDARRADVHERARRAIDDLKE